MDDRYPSTDDHQSVALDFPYPDAERDLSRRLPLVKWFLAIPHYIVLAFLYLAAIIAVILAWFAILFTGRYPRWNVRLRAGRDPLAQPRRGLCTRACDGSVSAVSSRTVARVGNAAC
jgi:hypothetical protein